MITDEPKISNGLMITIKRVDKIFDMKDYKVHALHDINFGIEKAQFIGLIGPSGSGKTTLINCLAGLIRPTNGLISYDSVDITKFTQAELREFRLKSIGLVFQDHLLVDSLTALENVELPLIFQRIDYVERRDRAIKWLNRVGLNKKHQNLPSELSGGEQQRVGIARALVTEPLVILADEPTGDLDTKTGQKIMQIFKEIVAQDGITVIMVSHDPRHQSQFDRIIRLSDGNIV